MLARGRRIGVDPYSHLRMQLDFPDGNGDYIVVFKFVDWVNNNRDIYTNSDEWAASSRAGRQQERIARLRRPPRNARREWTAGENSIRNASHGGLQGA